METQSQYAAPAIVDPSSGAVAHLERLPLEAAGSGEHDELWLQDLLYSFPRLIPVEEVEPVFDNIVSVCKELPTDVGPLDLVYVNEQGLLCLVECKLWRNPEARRKVVGQILDYAQQISRWSYEDLDAAIARAERPAGASLWEIARKAFGLADEAAFIDRVSRHLRDGTFLLLIVGDGIRENTEGIAAFLQKYAGLSFALGLIEERLFRVPGENRILVQPRILAKTVEMGRLIVRAEVGTLTQEQPAVGQMEAKTGRTLTETMFIEEVAGNSELADALQRLFSRLKSEGFNIEPSTRGASLKVVPAGTKMNLLTLSRNARVMNHGCGDSELGRRYLEQLAALLPTAKVKEVPADGGWSSTVQHHDGTSIRLEEIVVIAEPWIELLKRVRDELLKRNDSESE